MISTRLSNIKSKYPKIFMFRNNICIGHSKCNIINKKEACISNIYIDEPYRYNQYGTTLLNNTESILKNQYNVQKTNLTVHEPELSNLRDGVFNILGVDYENELGKCFNSNYSISIINSEYNQKAWLLAIEGNENVNEKECFNNYWQKQDENGREIIKEEYKNKEIVSSLLNNKKSIGTLLSEENIILISSSIDLLHESIDISEGNDSLRFNFLMFSLSRPISSQSQKS